MEKFCAEGREEEEGAVEKKMKKNDKDKGKRKNKKEQKMERTVQGVHRPLRTHSLARS